jgi:hypothetical protein
MPNRRKSKVRTVAPPGRRTQSGQEETQKRRRREVQGEPRSGSVSVGSLPYESLCVCESHKYLLVMSSWSASAVIQKGKP